MDQLESKEDHKKLASIVFEVDKITPSILMAKNCINRIEHIYLKKQLEYYRNMLKNAEDSFKDDSNLILKISEIQNKMNAIKKLYSMNRIIIFILILLYGCREKIYNWSFK